MKKFTHLNKKLNVNSLYRSVLKLKEKGEVDSILRSLSQNYVVEKVKIYTSEEKVRCIENVIENEAGDYFSTIAGFVYFRGEKEIGILPLLCVKKFSVKLLIPYTELVAFPINQNIIDKLVFNFGFTDDVTAEMKEKVETALFNGGGQVVDCVEGKEPVNYIPAKVCLAKEDIHRCYYQKMPCLSYGEINFYQEVKAGEKIGVLQEAKKGCDGQDVYKKIIPFDQFNFLEDESIGEGLTTKEDDVFSEIDGFLRIGVHGILSVKDLHIVEGNLYENYYNKDPKKDLLIKGHISFQVKILTEGSVYVEGNIEKSMVVAGGDIVVAGGILQGVYVDSKKNIEAQFASQSTILADGVVKIRKYIFSCNVFVGSWFLVLEKESGIISGSRVSAGNCVRAPIIGSNTGQITRLMLMNKAVKKVIEQRIESYGEFIQVLDKEATQFRIKLGANYFGGKELFIKNLPAERRQNFLKMDEEYEFILKIIKYFEKKLNGLGEEKRVVLMSGEKNKDLCVISSLKICNNVIIVFNKKEFIVRDEIHGVNCYRYNSRLHRIVAESAVKESELLS